MADKDCLNTGSGYGAEPHKDEPKKEHQEVTLPVTNAAKESASVDITTNSSHKNEQVLTPEQGPGKESIKVENIEGVAKKTEAEIKEPLERSNKTVTEIEQTQQTSGKQEKIEEIPGAYLWKQLLDINIHERTSSKEQQPINTLEHGAKTEHVIESSATKESKIDSPINIDANLQKASVDVNPKGKLNKSEINIAEPPGGENKTQQNISIPRSENDKQLLDLQDAPAGTNKTETNFIPPEHDFKGTKDIVAYAHLPKNFIDIYTPGHDSKIDKSIKETDKHKSKEEINIPELQHLAKSLKDVLPPELQKNKEDVEISWNQVVENIKDEVANQKVLDIKQFSRSKIRELYGDVSERPELYSTNAKPEEKTIKLGHRNLEADQNYIRNNPVNDNSSIKPSSFEDIIALVVADIAEKVRISKQDKNIADAVFEIPSNVDNYLSDTFHDSDKLIKSDNLNVINASISDRAFLRGSQHFSETISPEDISQSVTVSGTSVGSNNRIGLVEIGSPAKNTNELSYNFNPRIAEKQNINTIIPEYKEQISVVTVRPLPFDASGRISLTGVTAGAGARNSQNHFDLSDARLIKPESQTVSYNFSPLIDNIAGTNKPGTQQSAGMMSAAGHAKGDSIEPMAPIDRTIHKEAITPGININSLNNSMQSDAGLVKGTANDPRVQYNILRDPALYRPTITTFSENESLNMITDSDVIKSNSPDIANVVVGVDAAGNQIIETPFNRPADRYAPNTAELSVPMQSSAAEVKGTQGAPRLMVNIKTYSEAPERQFDKLGRAYEFNPGDFIAPVAYLRPGSVGALNISQKSGLSKDAPDNQIDVTDSVDRDFDDRRTVNGMVRQVLAERGMGFEKKLPLDLHLSDIPGFESIGQAARTLGIDPKKLNSLPEEMRINVGPFNLGQEMPYYDLYFTANRLSRPLGPRGAVSNWAKTKARKILKMDGTEVEVTPGQVPKTSSDTLHTVKPVVIITPNKKTLRGYGYLEVFSKGNVNNSGEPLNMAEEGGYGSGKNSIYRPPKPGARATRYGQETLSIPSRIPFQFKPEISGDSKSANWSALQILGRSNSLYTYTGSQNRSLQINLTYAVLEPPVTTNNPTEIIATTISDLAKSTIRKGAMNVPSAAVSTLGQLKAKEYQGMEDLVGWDEDTVYWIANTLRGLVVPQYHRSDNTAPPVVRLHYGHYFKKRVSWKDKNGQIVQKDDIDPLFIVTQVSLAHEGQINPETKRNQKLTISLNMIEVDEDIFTYEGFRDLSGYIPLQPQPGQSATLKQSIIDKIRPF